jgi:IS30 family transposase
VNNNKQLNAADRKVVETLLQENYSVKEIANKLGKNRSTIYRELLRCPKDAYQADLADLVYQANRTKCKQIGKIFTYEIADFIITKVKLGWSPEQIVGWLKKEKIKSPCIETVYKFIYEYPPNKAEKLYQYLRHGHKKRRKYTTGRKVQKSKIPNQVSIHERPINVLSRKEFGHFEGDSVIFPNKKAINTLNELKTGIVKFTLLDRKTSEGTQKAQTKRLKEFHKIKTLTLDNGTEFTDHQEVSKATGIKIYFCDPYSSWQRGSNENTNMLLRGYLPKRRNIDDLTQKELDDIAEELNNRPRKRLGFLTPFEAYQKELIKSVAVGVRM